MRELALATLRGIVDGITELAGRTAKFGVLGVPFGFRNSDRMTEDGN